MKKTICILSLIIIIFSCNSDKKPNNTKKNNSSIIIVEIPNAESEKLVLSIQGEDFENREIKTIKNGKAVFDITYNNSDVAFIESLYNFENIKAIRTWIPILLDNDSILVKSKMIKDSIQFSENEFKSYYEFKDKNIKKNNLNITYKKNNEKLFDLVRGVKISYNKLDSLNQNVFPSQRTNIINLFNKEFSNLKQRIQLELLYNMLNFTSFKPEYLNDKNREEVNKIYYNLSNLEKSASYRLKTVEYLISNINNYGKENQLIFKNFNLIDIEENKVNLKDIVGQNKFTVFYFWFSGCGPCRTFNKKINNETIKKLRENEIEFVSINTDFNEGDWKKSSKQDDIFWKNLYGGNFKEDIEYVYRIRGYPTKVVFNKNLEEIEFSFSNPKDLLKLKELQLEETIK